MLKKEKRQGRREKKICPNNPTHTKCKYSRPLPYYYSNRHCRKISQHYRPTATAPQKYAYGLQTYSIINSGCTPTFGDSISADIEWWCNSHNAIFKQAQERESVGSACRLNRFFPLSLFVHCLSVCHFPVYRSC